MKYQRKSVAFWIQLEPGQQMRGEGIGEHLMRLIRGLRDLGGYHAVICAPRWAAPVVRSMLAADGITEDTAEVRDFGPWFLGLRSIFRVRRKQKAGDPLPYAVARRIVEIPGWTLLAVLAVLFSPILLLLWLIGSRSRNFLRARLRGVAARARRAVQALTYAEMARFIDNDASITGCIVPIGNWEYCRYIERKPVAAQIPDIIFMEFPEYFRNDASVLNLMERIRYVANHAGGVICPSQHVKETHLVRGFGLAPEKVFVVGHAPMRLDRAFEALCVENNLPPTKESAIELCRRHQANHLIGARYLRQLGGSAYWLSQARDPKIWDRPKIYYPTQYRPYKNIEALIKAVAALRDKKGLEITLLLTADLGGDNRVVSLVDKLKLHKQVVIFPRVPLGIHGALYAASDLAIAGSRFEGGFPFQFSEAISVRTPVIMARIPVTLELLPEDSLERMTFDPMKVEDMAATIEKALNDHSLSEYQQDVFERVYRGRDWSDVAQGYMNALDYARRSANNRS